MNIDMISFSLWKFLFLKLIKVSSKLGIMRVSFYLKLLFN